MLSRLDTLSAQEAGAVVAGWLLPLDGILQYTVRVVCRSRRTFLRATQGVPLSDILCIKELVGRFDAEPMHTLINAFAK
jgi:hypothetical protein